jgi:hypothetical protein
VLKKKNRTIAEDAFADEFDDSPEDELDLFDVTSETSPHPAGVDPARALARQRIIDEIKLYGGLTPHEARVKGSHTPVGGLRKVVEWTEGKEGLDEVKSVLGGWRFMGKQVTQKTLASLIGE